MRIVIDYEASWRNSFLDGDNNKKAPRKGRKFIASMTEIKKKGNYLPREITLDTVLGVLNRLIGDQRKLYQIRSEFGNMRNYFADIENKIKFEDNSKIINLETVYLRNISGNTDQNSFTGMIRVDDPIFKSDYSSHFWGILWLKTDSLFEFILNHKPFNSDNQNFELDPISILSKLKEIQKLKPIEAKGKALSASKVLRDKFEEYKFNADKITFIRMYCSSLYLQLDRLEKQFDISSAKSQQGGISGISKNGVTPKDFMKCYTTTRKQKLVFGNPYIKEEFIKGGKTEQVLKKSSGQLVIKLNIDLPRSLELKKMIDNAGVSSFYLGKKGLAYVTEIDVR